MLTSWSSHRVSERGDMSLLLACGAFAKPGAICLDMFAMFVTRDWRAAQNLLQAFLDARP